MQQKTYQIKKFVKPTLYLFGLFLIGLAAWTDKYFGKASTSQALFSIKFGIDGALTSDPVFIKRFVKWCLVAPLTLTIFLILIEKSNQFFKLKWLNYLFKCKLHFLLPITGMLYVSYQFSIFDFIKGTHKTKTDYFKANYIDPKQLTFSTQHPKNLVLIYVESLETTYSDKKIFGHDLLQRLNKLKDKGISFANYKQMPETGWTIGGIVSTQCGIPLKVMTIFGNNRQGEILDDFLPKAKCLSDILAELGYENIFMKGPSTKFAGADKFLQNHHYTEIYGKEQWLAQGVKPKDMSGWGLYDDDLFSQAKKKLTMLIQEKKRFNLTLLTVDTHGYAGSLSKTCKKQNYHDFEGIVECTANQLADFVDFVSKKGWLDKVNIVILGDHLAMKNISYDKITSNPNRSIFNLIIPHRTMKKNTDNIVAFDMLPTILDSLGIHYKDYRLGLGYSALSPSHSILPTNRLFVMKRQIHNYSETYNLLWQT